MTSLGLESAPLDMGRVVSRTFGAIAANFVSFVVIVVLLSSFPTVALDYGIAYATPWIVDLVNPLSQPLLYSLVSSALSFLVTLPSYLAIGAVTHGAIVHYNGGRASFGECLSTGIRSLPFLFVLGLFTYVGTILWSLLFLIPGILAAVRWAVSSPALVVERIGPWQAFGRSIELTRNNRWRIFWLALIYVVLTLLIEVGIAYVSGSLGVILDTSSFAPEQTWLAYAVMTIYLTLNTMIGSAGAAALYFELRTGKEGATSDQLAKVFE